MIIELWYPGWYAAKTISLWQRVSPEKWMFSRPCKTSDIGQCWTKPWNWSMSQDFFFAHEFHNTEIYTWGCCVTSPLSVSCKGSAFQNSFCASCIMSDMNWLEPVIRHTWFYCGCHFEKLKVKRSFISIYCRNVDQLLKWLVSFTGTPQWLNYWLLFHCNTLHLEVRAGNYDWWAVGDKIKAYILLCS